MTDISHRPIGFFIHHQGSGHAKRFAAIAEHLGDRPISVLCADPALFDAQDERLRIIALPDMIGDPSRTEALHNIGTPSSMHCVPLGSARLRENAGLIGAFFKEHDPTLFFVDVSAEWTLLARLFSVPAVKVRMHGDRNDPGHLSAYDSAVGLVAPYDEAIEQADIPSWVRDKTFYAGGLCTTSDRPKSKREARAALGLDPRQDIFLVMSGGGGSGAPYAPLTMGARALPDALWLTIGPVHKEGHETDFGNLKNLGWVPCVTDYLCAADVVIASAGDNTVHEIARTGRPFLCIPEWRYFNEQVCKARELGRVKAAHVLQTWPGSLDEWREAISGARAINLARQKDLFNSEAGQRIADYLNNLEKTLWSSTESNVTRLARRVALGA